MKTGLILGLLTTPLMAQTTNGYDRIVVLPNLQSAIDSGEVYFNWVSEETGSVIFDNDYYYITPKITAYNAKYCYYQFAFGEQWFDWLGDNEDYSKIPSQYPHPTPSGGESIAGLIIDLNGIVNVTQAEITTKSQWDINVDYMVGAMCGTNFMITTNFALWDWNERKALWEDEISVNPYSGGTEEIGFYNVGVKWVIGNPSYVVNDRPIDKNYRTFGITYDLTSYLIATNQFNDFNNIVLENVRGAIGLIINFYNPQSPQFPNDEYATMTTISCRLGYGENLENTRYIDGYNTGYNNGYQQGYNDAPKTESEATIQSMLGMIFNSLKQFLDIQILPGIKVSVLLGIPIILTIAEFIIHWIRG